MLWERSKTKSLLLEAETIRQRLTSNNDLENVAVVSKKFEKHGKGKRMGKGNTNGALNLLTNNMTNGILPLDEKTLNSLKHKHPQSQLAYEETLINGEPPIIHPIIFDGINEELVGTTAIRTKSGSGLTGLNADGRRKILTSKVFGSCTFDLRKVIKYSEQCNTT